MDPGDGAFSRVFFHKAGGADYACYSNFPFWENAALAALLLLSKATVVSVTFSIIH
jgi:hypothetical protein